MQPDARFENLIDLAIDEAVDCLVIAGDLYDGDRDDFNTATFLQKNLHTLREAGIPVAIVYGNHDAANGITKRLQVPDNTKCFRHTEAETLVLEGCGLAVHGRSYPTRAVTEDLSLGYPVPISGLLNVGLLHTSLDGRPCHDPYAPCSIDGLVNRGYGYWALGHVHQREVVERDGVTVVFPGNLQGRHARETGPKGATIVEYDGDSVERIEERVLDVVRWTRVDVDASDLGTADALVDRALEAIAKATADVGDRLCAVRVAVNGTSLAHDDVVRRREQWHAQLRADVGSLSSQAWIEKIETNVAPPATDIDDESVGKAREAVHQVISTMVNDDADLGLLLEEVRPLRTKFGSDFAVFTDLTGLDLSPEGLRRLLPEIEATLVAELQRGEG